MIKALLKNILLSGSLGILFELMQYFLGTDYLYSFLSSDLIMLLITLLAINSATMSIVLTKISDLVSKYGHRNVFKNTKNQMVISIKEQVVLLVLAILLLMLTTSKEINSLKVVFYGARIGLSSVFAYSIYILYDTAKSIFILLELDESQP